MILQGIPIEDEQVRKTEEEIAVNTSNKILWPVLGENFMDTGLSKDDWRPVLSFTMWLLAAETPPAKNKLWEDYLNEEIEKVFKQKEYSHIKAWVSSKPLVVKVQKLLTSVNAFDINVLWELNGKIFGKDLLRRETWVDVVNQNRKTAFERRSHFDFSPGALKAVSYHNSYAGIKNKHEESLRFLK